jgi:hypothetical protein
MSLLYKDDVGVNLVIQTGNTTLPVDSVLTLVIEKPGTSIIEKAITTEMVNYTTGVIVYPTGVGDLDEAGVYKAQVRVAYTGVDMASDIDTFSVQEKLG